MLSVIYAECHLAECRKWALYTDCFYVECRYVECRYAESRGTLRTTQACRLLAEARKILVRREALTCKNKTLNVMRNVMHLKVNNLAAVFRDRLGSAKANGRDPKSCSGWVFNLKLGCFVMCAIARHIQARPSLELWTQLRFRPVSWSLSHKQAEICQLSYLATKMLQWTVFNPACFSRGFTNGVCHFYTFCISKIIAKNNWKIEILWCLVIILKKSPIMPQFSNFVILR
jgi:hypothetical protein